jgi:hypothetical protein
MRFLLLTTMLLMTIILALKRFRVHSPCANIRNEVKAFDKKSNIIDFLASQVTALNSIRLSSEESDNDICSLPDQLKNKHKAAYQSKSICNDRYIEIHEAIHILTESYGENELSKKFENLNEGIIDYFSEKVGNKIGVNFQVNRSIDTIFAIYLAEKFGDDALFDVIFLNNTDAFLNLLKDNLKNDENKTVQDKLNWLRGKLKDGDYEKIKENMK